MDVYCSVFWHRQHIVGQYPSVGHHDEDIRLEAFNKLGSGTVAQLRGLIYGNVMFKSQLLYRTEGQLHTPVSGLVRLSEYSRNIIFFVNEFFQ